MSDFLVTFDHMHSVPGWSERPGFCHRGGRELARRYGLDWRQIVLDGGVRASVLEATGDAMALHLVAHARSVVEAQRGQV